MRQIELKDCKLLTIFWLVMLVSASVSFIVGQESEDEVRDLRRSSWADKRTQSSDAAPAGAARSNKAKPSKPASLKYKIKQKLPPAGTTATPAADAELGLTIWRLRPANQADAFEIKDLVQPAGGGAVAEWTPERVEADTEFTEGQMVRLAIESLRPGYLYVINRAQYADGSYGNSYLIFPTQRIYGGRNFVRPKQVIQLPGPTDKPDYFELQRGQRQGERQVSEELIIIVKPEPFEAFKTAPADRRLLTPQSVEALITKYGAPVERAEMIDGAGLAITVAEKQAAQNDAMLLAADDPYPQTVYRVAAKPTEPMLVVLQLKVVGK